MGDIERVLPAPLERVGALLERCLSEDPAWSVGAIEREHGHVHAQLRAGFVRARFQLRFQLESSPDATTRVTVEVAATSPWGSLASCHRHTETLLERVVGSL